VAASTVTQYSYTVQLQVHYTGIDTGVQVHYTVTQYRYRAYLKVNCTSTGTLYRYSGTGTLNPYTV
jgi:hypothetical protein